MFILPLIAFVTQFLAFNLSALQMSDPNTVISTPHSTHAPIPGVSFLFALFHSFPSTFYACLK